ncbi:hypothetical protein [Caulobacter sp. X]|uniref:hypothetical protein n=1 Tax=Caulobacter sp. X TaxID=2048901 RepID=UPI001F2658DD|nr:hypothetical protein [Caulobacter sp. X]
MLTAGRFTAWPVRWQGWAAMIVLIAGPLAGMMVLTKALPRVPSIVFLIGAFVLCFGTIFPLAYFKGRPSKRSGV